MQRSSPDKKVIERLRFIKSIEARYFKIVDFFHIFPTFRVLQDAFHLQSIEVI